MSKELSEEEKELERIFGAAKQKRAQGLVAALSREAMGEMQEPDLIVKKLQLLEATSVKMRAKLTAPARAFIERERKVLMLEMWISAALRVPLERRVPTTPSSVVMNPAHEGMLYHIIEVHPFQISSSSEQMLLCTTLVERIDAFSILTGNFVFLLLDGGSRRWTTDNIADTMPGEGVVRHNISDYGVLRERAVLVNFYFDDVPWSTHIPVTEMKIN